MLFFNPPPNPRLDINFLMVSFCALFFNVMFVIYYVKATKYKRELEALKKQFHNLDHSTISPQNSNPTIAKRQIQSKGGKNV